MKILKKIWELTGDERFTMTFIAVCVTFMTIINVTILLIPLKLKIMMIVLNIVLVITTLTGLFIDKKKE